LVIKALQYSKSIKLAIPAETAIYQEFISAAAKVYFTV
jgi:hypothetical protein